MKSITPLLSALSATLVITGCQTTSRDAYTGEEKTSGATKGTVAGAVAGAVLGNQVKGNSKTRRNARIAGAIIGGLIGNRAGNYMDEQEEQLRRELSASGVGVTREGENIVLNMPGNITFASGKSAIRSDFYPVLGDVARVLKEFDKTRVEIAGHTDSVGSAADNQALSQQRASSVGRYLRSKGVAAGRISSNGFGESQPMVSNKTPDGRAANRRVEITLSPLAH